MTIRLPTNKAWLIILAVLILSGLWIASKMEFRSETKWTDHSQQQNKSQGTLFGLSVLLKAELPGTPRVSLRNWSQFHHSPATTSIQQLLFVGDTDGASQSDYQTLLTWVAAGNHAVLPLPSRALSVDIRNVNQTNSSTPRTAPSVRYAQWLHQTLAVDLQEAGDETTKILPKTGSPFTQSACRQALTRIQEANQVIKDEDGKSTTLTDPLKNHFLLNCARQLNDIRLPEGDNVAWFDDNPVALKPLPGARVLWQGQGLSGSHIIRLAYGKGSIILLSTIAPLGNPEDPSNQYNNDITRFDHAYLARYLAQNKTRLVFVREMESAVRSEPSSPWWRLWLAQPLLMILLMVGMILLIWRFGLRLGAVHSASTEETLDLTTYLHAQGQFLAHHGTATTKLGSMQNVLSRQWQNRWPNWLQLNHTTKLSLLRDYYPNAETGDLALWLNVIPDHLSDYDWLRYLQAHQRMTHFSGNRPY